MGAPQPASHVRQVSEHLQGCRADPASLHVTIYRCWLCLAPEPRYRAHLISSMCAWSCCTNIAASQHACMSRFPTPSLLVQCGGLWPLQRPSSSQVQAVLLHVEQICRQPSPGPSYHERNRTCRGLRQRRNLRRMRAPVCGPDLVFRNTSSGLQPGGMASIAHAGPLGDLHFGCHLSCILCTPKLVLSKQHQHSAVIAKRYGMRRV